MARLVVEKKKCNPRANPPAKRKQGQRKKHNARGAASRKGARALKALERERIALEMAIRGDKLKDIAKACGYNGSGTSAAQAAINRALEKANHQPAEELRTLWMQRLQVMLRKVWSDLGTETDGVPELVCPMCKTKLTSKMVRDLITYLVDRKHAAIDRILKIADREAKLQGLDAPVKQEVEHKGKVEVEHNHQVLRELMADADFRSLAGRIADKLAEIPG